MSHPDRPSRDELEGMVDQMTGDVGAAYALADAALADDHTAIAGAVGQLMDGPPERTMSVLGAAVSILCSTLLELAGRTGRTPQELLQSIVLVGVDGARAALRDVPGGQPDG